MNGLAIFFLILYLVFGIAWGVMFSRDFIADPEDSYVALPTRFEEIRNRIIAFFVGVFFWPLIAGAWACVNVSFEYGAWSVSGVKPTRK